MERAASKIFLVQREDVHGGGKMIEFMPVARETYCSTPEVILDTRILLTLWFRLLLHQMGCKYLLVIIDEGVKVNSQIYLNMLQEKVLPCVTNFFWNHYIFTKDGAPAQTANVKEFFDG